MTTSKNSEKKAGSTENLSDVFLELIVDREKAEANLAFRYMDLWHRARRANITLAIIVVPNEVQHMPFNQFKEVGSHPADLACALDIAESNIIGLSWREEAYKKTS